MSTTKEMESSITTYLRSLNYPYQFRNDDIDKVLTWRDGCFYTQNTISFIQIAATENELSRLLDQQQSFKEVFYTWDRFSILKDNDTLHAVPEEEDGWEYNPDTDSVNCTTNSTSYVGFYSPEKYDNYVFDVNVKSIDEEPEDDDDIGLVIGLVEENGRYHTLSVIRSINNTLNPRSYQEGGMNPDDVGALRVVYNYRIEKGDNTPEDQQQVFFASTGKSVTYANGALTAKDAGGNNSDSWYNQKSARIQVNRSGNEFTIYGSNTGSNYLHTDDPIRFSLDDHPFLERFKGPGVYGYSSRSQNNASFEVISRPGSRAPILDTRTNSLFTYDGISWRQKAYQEGDGVITVGSIVHSSITGQSFLYTGKEFQRLLG